MNAHGGHGGELTDEDRDGRADRPAHAAPAAAPKRPEQAYGDEDGDCQGDNGEDSLKRPRCRTHLTDSLPELSRLS